VLHTYDISSLRVNVHGPVHRNNILVYKSQQDAQVTEFIFCLTIALHVSGIIITHLQEHKTTVTTAYGNRYTVIDTVFTVKDYI